MSHGVNRFRYFVCARGGEWRVCPCGWQPMTGWDGPHYASRDHVRWWRKIGLKKLRDGIKRGKSDPLGIFPNLNLAAG
jgi:hypothetical protein